MRSDFLNLQFPQRPLVVGLIKHNYMKYNKNKFVLLQSVDPMIIMGILYYSKGVFAGILALP